MKNFKNHPTKRPANNLKHKMGTKKIVSDKGNINLSHKVKLNEYKKLTTFRYQAIVLKSLVFFLMEHIDIFKINVMVINDLCRKFMR